MTYNKLKGLNDNYRRLTSHRLLGKHSLGLVQKTKIVDVELSLTLRAYPNNPLYPQGKPDACVVSQKRSQHGENHASEHFWPAALASNFSLGLITTRLFR